MKQQKKRFEKFIILALTGIFAVCIFLVLFMGVNTYSRLTARDRIAYDRRTCAQYITTKIRQSDSTRAVSVEPFGDSSALVLREDIDGAAYLTRIYIYKGYLTELFSAENAHLEPIDGTRIMKLNGLSFSYEGDLLNIIYADETGKSTEMSVSLRSKEGVSE